MCLNESFWNSRKLQKFSWGGDMFMVRRYFHVEKKLSWCEEIFMLRRNFHGEKKFWKSDKIWMSKLRTEFAPVNWNIGSDPCVRKRTLLYEISSTVEQPITSIILIVESWVLLRFYSVFAETLAFHLYCYFGYWDQFWSSCQYN